MCCRAITCSGLRKLFRACVVKILLLGKNGQVGWELQRSLAPLGELIALDSVVKDCAATSRIWMVLQDDTRSCAGYHCQRGRAYRRG